MQWRHYPHSDFAKETYFKKSQFHDRLCTARNAGYPVLTNFIRMLCNTLQARRERGQIRIMDIVEEGWEMDGGPFPVFDCPFCSRGMRIPKQVIDETEEAEEKEKHLGRPKSKR